MFKACALRENCLSTRRDSASEVRFAYVDISETKLFFLNAFHNGILLLGVFGIIM
jgi:hypothetical protein